MSDGITAAYPNDETVKTTKSKLTRVSLSEQAGQLIARSKMRDFTQKQSLVAQLITYVNSICEREHLQYFAIGRLLSWCFYEKDNYPGKSKYQIGMLRSDFEVFESIVIESAHSSGMHISSAYEDGSYLSSHNRAVLVISRSSEDKNSALTVSLSVLPVDRLPSDAEERAAFISEIERANLDLRQTSARIRYLLSENCTLANLHAKLLLKIRYRAYMGPEHLATYRKLLSRYDHDDTADYLGRLEIQFDEPYSLKDALPVQKKPFLDTYLMTPACPDGFKVPARNVLREHIRTIRCRTLKRLGKLCDDVGISYFAMGSLLTEAVEMSNGAPPRKKVKLWRVGMMRADYEKALEVLERQGQKYGLVLQQGAFFAPFPKRVIARENDKRDILQRSYPILLEPVDFLPNNPKLAFKFVKEVHSLYKRYQIAVRYERGREFTGDEKLVSAKVAFAELDHLARRYENEKHPRQAARLCFNGTRRLEVEDLIPTGHISFRGIELSIPANKYCWLAKKSGSFVDNEVEKKLDLLDRLNRVCDKLNIEYFAVSDLLISAVVYHDSIPGAGNYPFMVGLVRPHYEKLLAYLRGGATQFGLSVVEYRDDTKTLPLMAPRVTRAGDEHTRYNVRLLSFDKIPESFYLRKALRDELRTMNALFKKVVLYRAGKQSPCPDNTEIVPEELFEKYKDANLNDFACEINKMAQRYDDDEQAYLYEHIALAFSKIIDAQDLYPLQRVTMRDVGVLCPHDYSVWQPIQDEALKHQVKCIQKVVKRIIAEFDRVCLELGLGYFVCGGTLLGCVRHGGFIPWDDDADCAMLRADYDRFLAQAPQILGDGFFLQTRESDPNIPYLFSKIRVNNTEYITHYNENRDFHKGICLDIFPFDFLPNKKVQREAFVEEVETLAHEHHSVAQNQYAEVDEPWPARNDDERRIIEEQKKEIADAWKVSLASTQQKYLDAATRYNAVAHEEGLTTVGSFVPTYTYIDLTDLFPYQRAVFEDLEVSVPKRPDIFLKMQYGNYLVLPPEHERVAHRLEKWSDGVEGDDRRKRY